MIFACDAHRLAISLTLGHRNNSFVFVKFIKHLIFLLSDLTPLVKNQKTNLSLYRHEVQFSNLNYFFIFSTYVSSSGCFFLICFATPDLQNYMNHSGNGTGIFKNNRSLILTREKRGFADFQ